MFIIEFFAANVIVENHESKNGRLWETHKPRDGRVMAFRALICYNEPMDFITDVLTAKIKAKKNPSVVGLDPDLSFVPDFIKAEAFDVAGATPQGAAEAIYAFNTRIIDAVYDIVPAVKPNIAFYERFGAAGVEKYIKTVEYAHKKGLLVIGDAKRGGAAPASRFYADAHLGRVKIGEKLFEIYGEDFLTVNPYAGTDSLEPFAENCRKYGKGLFVLVKTSSAGGGDIQDLRTDGKTVCEAAAEMIKTLNGGSAGRSGFAPIGVAVGASAPDITAKIRAALPKVYFLTSGYGAQGKERENVRACFLENGGGAAVNASRGICAAYKTDKYKNEFPETEFDICARKACMDMRDELAGFF